MQTDSAQYRSSGSPQGSDYRPTPQTSNAGAPRRGLPKWIFALLFLAAIGVGGFVWWRHHSAAAKSASPTTGRGAGVIPVVVATARVGDVPIQLPELGVVTPFNTVTIHTRVDGQVMKVAFTEGQIVHQGDLLAQIDPRPFTAALEQSQGALVRDQALLENAKLDLQRYHEAAAGTFTQQQIDTQQALVDQDNGLVQIDQGQVDNAKVQLDYCQITAPLTGRIGLRQIDQGNIIHAADPNGLAVITQLQPIAVIFPIADVDIPSVLGNSPSAPKLKVDAYTSDLSTKLASGVLTAVDSQIDTTTAKLKLKAVFDNADFALFPNQFVNVNLLVRTVRDAVIVPPSAVQRGPDNSAFVYIVKSDNTIEVRPITVGPQQGDLQAISTGVEAGDVVVTDGVDKLVAGSKVVPRQAATQPTASAANGAEPTTRKSHHGHHNAATQSDSNSQ